MELMRAIFNTIDDTKRAVSNFFSSQETPDIQDQQDLTTYLWGNKYPKIDQTKEERYQEAVKNRSNLFENPANFLPGSTAGTSIKEGLGAVTASLALPPILEKTKEIVKENPQAALGTAAALSMLLTQGLLGKYSAPASKAMGQAGAFRTKDQPLHPMSLAELTHTLKNVQDQQAEVLATYQSYRDSIKARLQELPATDTIYRPNLEADLAYFDNVTQNVTLQKTLWDKLTPKELAKYGTKEFQLDPILEHSNLPEAQKAQFLGLRKESDGYSFNDSAAFDKDIIPSMNFLTEHYLEAPNIDPLKIQQKSLASLLQPYEAHLKAIRKEQAGMLDAIVKRTAVLRKEQAQEIPFDSIVKINDIKDRSADTEILNHCAASFSNPTGTKFISVYHPGTGERRASESEMSQGPHADYSQRIRAGEIDLYSYRPEGLPVLTIQYNKQTGQVGQIHGENNRNATPEEMKAIKPFIDWLQEKTAKERRQKADFMQTIDPNDIVNFPPDEMINIGDFM